MILNFVHLSFVHLNLVHMSFLHTEVLSNRGPEVPPNRGLEVPSHRGPEAGICYIYNSKEELTIQNCLTNEPLNYKYYCCKDYIRDNFILFEYCCHIDEFAQQHRYQ